MDLSMYELLEPIPFAIPVNPGSVSAILQTSTTATIKVLTLEFDHTKNYFNSYNNIHRACFKMLNDSIPEEFKVSNNPALTGWNSTMSILDILNQLNTLYGRPEPMTLIQSDALFCLPFRATGTP